MASYSQETLRRFANAAYQAGVLEEKLSQSEGLAAYEAWVSRRDAQAIAETKEKPDMVAVIRAAGEEFATNLLISEKMTLDAMKARRILWASERAPDAELLVEINKTGMKYTVKEIRPDEQVSSRTVGDRAQQELLMSDDASALAPILSASVEARDLADTARTLREHVPEEAFGGRGLQMRLLLAPWLAARLLGLRRGTISMAAEYRNESARAPAQDHEGTAMARAMETALRACADGLRNIRVLRGALIEDCRPDRTSSRVGEAVDFFMAQPIASARAVERALGMSRKGANMLLDRMLAGAVIEPTDPDQTKNRTFVCRRALTL